MNRTSLLVIIFLTLGNAPQATASSWFVVSTALAYIAATNISQTCHIYRERQEEARETPYQPLHEAAGTEKSTPIYTGQ